MIQVVAVQGKVFFPRLMKLYYFQYHWLKRHFISIELPWHLLKVICVFVHLFLDSVMLFCVSHFAFTTLSRLSLIIIDITCHEIMWCEFLNFFLFRIILYLLGPILLHLESWSMGHLGGSVGVCLRLRSWSQGPGTQPYVGLPASQGACFSLCLSFCLLSPLLGLSLSKKNKQTKNLELFCLFHKSFLGFLPVIVWDLHEES